MQSREPTPLFALNARSSRVAAVSTRTSLLRFLLLLVFIAVPVAEIAVFIQVGDLIGLWPTLAAIVATAVVGTAILRRQGIAVLRDARRSIDDGGLPIRPVVHGLFLVIAGALLLTPGFLTDGVGFLLLVPTVRLKIADALLQAAKRSKNFRFYSVDMGGARPETTGRGRGRPQNGPIIEGEVIREDPGTRGEPGDSPWRAP